MIFIVFHDDFPRFTLAPLLQKNVENPWENDPKGGIISYFAGLCLKLSVCI